MTGRTIYHTTTFMCQGWRTDPGVRKEVFRYRALLLTDVPFFPAAVEAAFVSVSIAAFAITKGFRSRVEGALSSTLIRYICLARKWPPL